MACKVNIDNFDRSHWEQQAKGFADYSIYQTWPYQYVRAETDGQKVSRFIIENENGQVLMMGQVRIKNIKPLGLKIGYVQWGPLVRRIDGTLMCGVDALEALRAAYVKTKVNVLRITPNVCYDETGRQLSEMLITSGFQHVRFFPQYRTLVLQVDDSEEEIRKRLHKSFRRDLRYAEKSGIEIHQCKDEKFCEILKSLYYASLKRKDFKGLDINEFIKPQHLLSATEKMNIVVSYYDSKPISAHLTSNLGDTAVVLLSASNETGLKKGSSYLVWYRGAISALESGLKWYDLGGVDPDHNPSVYQFKTRMGGRETFHIGAFDACESRIVKAVWHIGDKVYRRIKNHK